MSPFLPHWLPVLPAWRRCSHRLSPDRPSRLASRNSAVSAGGVFRSSCEALPWLVFSATPALAQSTNTLVLHSDLPDVGLSLIRLLAAMALVLAVFFGGVWLFRNGQRLAWRKTGRPRLAIVESRALGNRFAIYVVGYDRQRFLVGSSPAGLALLSPLPPGEPESPELAVAAEPVTFARNLQALLKRGPERGAGGAP
jgi:flagellar biogenesis protein FliO